jgi:hypothetical protein
MAMQIKNVQLTSRETEQSRSGAAWLQTLDTTFHPGGAISYFSGQILPTHEAHLPASKVQKAAR